MVAGTVIFGPAGMNVAASQGCVVECVNLWRVVRSCIRTGSDSLSWWRRESTTMKLKKYEAIQLGVPRIRSSRRRRPSIDLWDSVRLRGLREPGKKRAKCISLLSGNTKRARGCIRRYSDTC
jgi:hypothetical protein